MPELPEVETCRRGIAPGLEGKRVTAIRLQRADLRWPISTDIEALTKHPIEQVGRRGKYLLLQTQQGTALLHLGMSGRLNFVSPNKPLDKHDHVDFIIESHQCLRFNDSRRFGALLWTEQPLQQHPLLANLGVEPLSEHFNAHYLWQYTQKSRRAIKVLLMDHQIIAGIGNIYANEALFNASVNPFQQANQLSFKQISALVQAIKITLQQAVKTGGTTLRDFHDVSGQPGYFQQQLWVYGRAGQPCYICGRSLNQRPLAQRSTIFCEYCQPTN